MPIYEYMCQSCGQKLEKLQRMNDAPLTDCPECGEVSLRRLISAAAFRLKGAGWYETDFKKEGKKNLHDSDGAGSSDAPKSASSASNEKATPAETKKTETKAAPKTPDSA